MIHAVDDRTTNGNNVFRYVDWFTIIIYFLLVIGGVFSIYAASYDFDQASIFSMDEFSGKQIMWIGISLVVGLVLLLIDARMYETYAYPIYIAVLLLLVLTIFIAPDIKGSHSWIKIGSFSLQPAEFAKTATALALARLFNTYNFRLNDDRGNYMKALAIIFVPVLLILLQKETGSALVFTSLFFVLYREGMSGLVLLAALAAVVIFVVAIKFQAGVMLDIPLGHSIVFILVMVMMVAMTVVYSRNVEFARNIFLWYTGTGLLVGLLSLLGVTVNGYFYFLSAILVACGYLVLMYLRGRGRGVVMILSSAIAAIVFLFSVNIAFSMLGNHQKNRINVTLGVVNDVKAAGYNVNQSKIAIGSGGFVGKGFLNGTQTKLKYVPEQHTDFIYCTIGEEEGFIGSSLVLLLFLVLIFRVITIAERQPTTFGRVYAYCVASYFIFHLCINIGMVIGLCPVIGIPLPFFSYGGSSMLGFTILLFILLRIDAARREHLSF